MEEKTPTKVVIVFPIRNEQVLLARKTGKIGAGCLNGYGGEIEDGESARQAAVRELEEESGLEVLQASLEEVALITFHNQKVDGTIVPCEGHVFFARGCDGVAKSTPEMAAPTWFNITAIAYDEMMLADKEWLPLVFAGKKIIGTVWYGPFQKTLLKPTIIREVESFD